MRINFDQLRYEADYRYGLVHIRNNAESIAFYSGEQQEAAEVTRRLATVVENFNLLIIWEVIIDVMRRSIIYASNFIPYLVIAAPILAGEMDYGGFAQANVAFNLVEGSLFFIMNNIEALARFTASINRLEGFQSKVEHLQPRSTRSRDYVPCSARAPGACSAMPTVKTPRTDNVLVRDLSFSVGETRSAVGGGTLRLWQDVAAADDQWPVVPQTGGPWIRPPTGELLFIPQRPYMLLGSLREQLCYPTEESRFSDEQLRHVLDEVMLGKLSSAIPIWTSSRTGLGSCPWVNSSDWPSARLLLNAPTVVVLDEATSALDVATEEHLYSLLRQRELSVISIGHRPTLKQFHDSVLELTGDGGWRLLPATSYDFGRS